MLAYMGQARDQERARRSRAEVRPMIRFAWLQFRTQAAVVFGGLPIVAVILAVHRPAPVAPL